MLLKKSNKPETNIDIMVKGGDTQYNSDNNIYNVSRRFLNDFRTRVSPEPSARFPFLEEDSTLVNNKRD
jgi:hypothetical protein